MTDKANAVDGKAELDEVELFLQLLNLDFPELIEGRTYAQIAASMSKKFGKIVDEQDVRLIHEPTIDIMEEDLRVQFDNLGLYY